MPSCTQGWGGRVWRGGKGAPSPPSSCNTGLKQIQRTICMSSRPIPHVLLLFLPRASGKDKKHAVATQSKFLSREETGTLS